MPVDEQELAEYVSKNGDLAQQVGLNFVDGAIISTVFLGVVLMPMRTPDTPPLTGRTHLNIDEVVRINPTFCRLV